MTKPFGVIGEGGKAFVSCDEFEQFARFLDRCELIDGEVIQLSPNTIAQSLASTNIGGMLYNFVQSGELGWVCTNLGMRLKEIPPRCRASDIAYISKSRLPDDMLNDGFLRVPPELVVEVRSVKDSWRYTNEKAADFIEFGVDVVWIADPSTRTVKIVSRGADPVIIHDGSEIEGGPMLKGFKTPVAKFFTVF